MRLLAIELNVPESTVRDARSLRRELRMDSVAAANLLFALEEEYGIELEIEQIERFDSAGDITEAVERSRRGAAG